MTDQQAAKTDHVQIVVLDALMRRKIFLNQAGSNPGHFVRGDGHPNPAATDAHAAIHRPGGNRPGQRDYKIWIIVVRLQLAVAKIGYFITGFA